MPLYPAKFAIGEKVMVDGNYAGVVVSIHFFYAGLTRYEVSWVGIDGVAQDFLFDDWRLSGVEQ